MQRDYSQKRRWQGWGWIVLFFLVLGVILQSWRSFAISRADTTETAKAFAQVKQDVQNLQAQLQDEVSAWGEQHLYADNFDGQTYSQDYEYDNQHGIGGTLWLQGELKSQTLASYNQAKTNLQNWLYNFQAMAEDYNDSTPADQVHQADLDLLQHYGAMGKRAVVVSLGEQVMRVYDDGNLVKAFLVTTGEPSLPTPPGIWSVEAKLHPTTFTSSAPKNSPDWYPPTKINYAMQYHNNGYFMHDAWWRTEFGPASNYPHEDQGVDGSPLASMGSHGCVDMPPTAAQWLYNFVTLSTPVIIY